MLATHRQYIRREVITNGVTMSTKHTKLLSPGTINGMTLKNRIALAAMGSNFACADGHCSERMMDYYEARARGGVGLLILETSAIDWPAGASMPHTLGFSKDEFIADLKQLTDRLHKHGAKIAAQLNHSGKVAQEDVIAGRPVLVPSVPLPKRSDMMELLTQEELGNFIKAAGPDGKGPRYHPLNQDDIDALVQQFADAADRAQRAGFDAVELHAGHGYVLSSFLSPAINQRTDQYGGGVENRARLLCEVIEAVRQRVGKQFPIIVRLDAKEFRVDGGITPEDSVTTAKLAETAGADAIDVSAYGNPTKGISFTEAPLPHQPSAYLEFTRAIKKAVSIPVITVGRVELDKAEQGLIAGEFDFVAMGRKLLADQELPNKLAQDRMDEIRPCIYCYVCVSQIFINQPMCCAVNPATGREQTLGLIASDAYPAASKNVIVIGGGPAGMEAASTLAHQGHNVSLWERDSTLGGTAKIAALAYEPNGRLIRFLQHQVQQLPVRLRLGVEANVESIVAERPDHVIVATGAQRNAPDIKGKHLPHVFDGEQLRGLLFGNHPTALRKLPWASRAILKLGKFSGVLHNIEAMRLLSRFWMPLKKRVVIIGGGLAGLELAEYLLERGRQVTVLEPTNNLGPELSIVRRSRVVHTLKSHGAALVTNVTDLNIQPDAVHYQLDDHTHMASGDQVIIAMGASADGSLSDQLNARGIATTAIGDCREVGYIEGAILDARQAALSL